MAAGRLGAHSLLRQASSFHASRMDLSGTESGKRI